MIVMLMIEEAEAVKNIDEIAAVPAWMLCTSARAIYLIRSAMAAT